MTVKFAITTADGQEGELTADSVMNQLGQAGYNPQGVSPDGMNITLVDDQGEYTKPIAEIAQQLGHQVGSITPENPGIDNVSPQLRFAVENLDDDDDRRSFLQAKVDRMHGPGAPRVMGQGSDWHYFDPVMGQYQALTNAPGADMSDISEAVTTGGKILGSAVGFAGSGGNPLGAAAGNMGANAALRTVASAKEGEFLPHLKNMLANVGQGMTQSLPGMEERNIPQTPERQQVYESGEKAMAEENMGRALEHGDPDFFAQQSPGEMATSIGAEGAIDAAFAGGLKGAGAMLPKARSFVQSSPVSRAGHAASRGGEAVGGMVQGGVEMMEKAPQAVQELGKYFAPWNPAANATLTASLFRAPRGMVTMGAEGLESLGKSDKFAKMFGDKAAGKVSGFAEDIMQREAGAPLQASDVLKNLGQKAGGAIKNRGFVKQMDDAVAGKPMRETPFADWAEEGLGRFGQSTGQFLHRAGQAGKGVENVLRGGTDIAARGIGGTGSALQGAGQMGRSAFKGIAPAEPWGYYGAGRYGAGAMTPDLGGGLSEEQEIFNRWRRQRRQANIGLDHI